MHCLRSPEIPLDCLQYAWATVIDRELLFECFNHLTSPEDGGKGIGGGRGSPESIGRWTCCCVHCVLICFVPGRATHGSQGLINHADTETDTQLRQQRRICTSPTNATFSSSGPPSPYLQSATRAQTNEKPWVCRVSTYNSGVSPRPKVLWVCSYSQNPDMYVLNLAPRGLARFLKNRNCNTRQS